MNEKIKEFAEQASKQSPDGYPVVIPYSDDFAEKFAELIVQECTTIDLYWLSDSNKKAVVEKIKQHFGIKK